MKKFIIISILMIFSLGSIGYKAQISKTKLNLDVKENELVIIFFKEKQSEYIYVKTKDENSLLPVKVKNSSIPYKTINKLGIVNLKEKEYKKSVKTNNLEKKLNNFEIKFNKNKKEIANTEFNFCIYEKGEVPECKYIYFKKQANINNSNLELALYNDRIDEQFEKNLLEKWIDTYKIKRNEITIVRLSKDDYSVLKVPEYYFK